jgi:acetyl-CoA acetyltransferase family protein
MSDTTVGWRFVNPRMRDEWTVALGLTAENVAERYGIGREEQERFAAESQRRALQAIEDGAFRDETVAVEIPQRDGTTRSFEVEEHPRRGVDAESLARLKPAFKKGGTVTAGTSSGINDGAAALVVGSDELRGDRTPMARLVASAVVGVDPAFMGLGPIQATRTALDRAGLSIDRIDLIELNEAFASIALACMRELELDPERVNVHGGAIALGHPLGCTGAKMLTTLVHALRRTGGRYGLATMCIGVGQGMALVVERI